MLQSKRSRFHALAMSAIFVFIATFVAVNPAAGTDTRALATALALMSCSSASPCLGWHNAGSGPAIEGTATTGYGLDGVSTHASGVYGATTNASATTGKSASGVIGRDASTDRGILNQGVLGISTNGTGVNGVSTQGDGVHGTTSAGQSSQPPGAGVFGQDLSTTSPANFGVYGISTQGTGVFGASTTAIGVMASSVTNYAVYAQTNLGTAVYATTGGSGDALFGDSSGGIGLVVHSGASDAVVAQQDAGNTAPAMEVDSASGNTNPTIRAFGGDSTTSGQTLATFNSSSTPTFCVDNAGNAHVAGQIFTGGACSGGCIARVGTRTSQVERYTPQEAAPTIEDEGEATLVNGSAYVPLDPVFARVMDPATTYLVFITPQGLTHGLYVANKTMRGFAVLETPGEHSTAAFDYRIVAKPLGQAQRFPMVTLPRATRAQLNDREMRRTRG